MNKRTSYQKIFTQLLDEKAFYRAEEYNSDSVISILDNKEKKLLSDLLFRLGQQQIEGDKNKAYRSFKSCVALSSSPYESWLSIGHLFMEHSLEEYSLEDLEFARDAFSQAIQLNYDDYQGWYGLALSIHEQGVLLDDPEEYLEANQHFDKALELVSASSEQGMFQVLWKSGVNWMMMGKVSGEAHDLFVAKQRFEEAVKLEENPTASFFIDYANVLWGLSHLFSSLAVLNQAIAICEEGLEKDARYYQGWLLLGVLLSHKYRHHARHDQDQIKACAAFEKAIEIDPEIVSGWESWIEFLLQLIKIKKDTKYIQQSIEAAQMAVYYHDDEPNLLAMWAEALTYYVVATDEFLVFKDAREKLEQALIIDKECCLAWVVMGDLLFDEARYFMDFELFEQAIEKYAYALTMEEKNERACEGIARTLLAWGEETQDLMKFEHALEYYQQRGKTHPVTVYFLNEWGTAYLKLAEITSDQFHVEMAVQKLEEAIALNDRLRGPVDLIILYNYGCALDYLGDFSENSELYRKAVDVLEEVVDLAPDFLNARYNLALALSHLAESSLETELFQESLEHFHYLVEQDPEDEVIWCDWGVTLIAYAQLLQDPYSKEKVNELYQEAENKLSRAASLGNPYAFYNLACLYSLMRDYELSLRFLEQADKANGLPPLAELLNDNWMEGVRQTPAFQIFLDLLLKKYPDQQL